MLANIRLFKWEDDVLMVFQKGNTLGNKFTKGIKFTDEWKKQHSERMIGINNPFYGKQHTETTKQKIRKSRLGEKNPNFGKSMSDEQKLKIGDAQRGEKSNNWKGGIKKHYGYVLIYKPEHPYANCQGYIPEHRYIMEQFLGRYLLPEEVVHHINGIKDDNRIENLGLYKTQGEHVGNHNKINKRKNKDNSGGVKIDRSTLLADIAM